MLGRALAKGVLVGLARVEERYEAIQAELFCVAVADAAHQADCSASCAEMSMSATCCHICRSASSTLLWSTPR